MHTQVKYTIITIIINFDLYNILTGPPSAPRNLMVVSTTSTTITLSWDPPESLGGRTDLTYVIEYQDLQKSTVDTLELNINTVIITG